jgi:anaerobic magnesium-protoporphyrin IX monomethyl ester cyclase
MEDYLSKARSPAKKSDRYMVVLTSRGCPYHCNFCFHTNEFRFRNADKVAEEITILQDNYRERFENQRPPHIL